MKHNIGVGIMMVGWATMILVGLLMKPGASKTEGKIFGLTLIALGLQLATL